MKKYTTVYMDRDFLNEIKKQKLCDREPVQDVIKRIIKNSLK